MGEAVCVFVIPDEGAAPPRLEEVVAWLDAAGLARQKFPERIEVVDDLPRTASGKVKKDILRRMIAEKIALTGLPT